MKKCQNCGATVNDAAKFCEECGAKTEIANIVQASPQTEKTQTIVVETKNNNTVIIGGFVVLALLLAIVAVVFLGGNSNNSTEPTYDNVSKQYANDIVIHWYHIDSSAEDDWNVYTPYVENGYLYIPVEAEINSNYTVQYRGFGTASISDTFEKTVPFKHTYENSTVTKGEYQSLTLCIPITDLDVQRPTTLHCNLATYVGGNQRNIKLEFDISW